MRRRAVETMIKTYGQTPKLLFQLSHPHRMDLEISPLQDSSGGLVAQLIQRGASVKNITGSDREKVWVSVGDGCCRLFILLHAVVSMSIPMRPISVF